MTYQRSRHHGPKDGDPINELRNDSAQAKFTDTRLQKAADILIRIGAVPDHVIGEWFDKIPPSFRNTLDCYQLAAIVTLMFESWEEGRAGPDIQSKPAAKG